MPKLSFIAALLLAALTAACGPNLSTNIPTVDPNAASTEPTVTPNAEQADEGTVEATAEMTAEGTEAATADQTAEATVAVNAEGTAALETAFAIQVTGDSEVTIRSDDSGEVSDMLSGASTGVEGGEAATTGIDAEDANTTGQSVLNTPPSVLRILRFTNADENYLFELTLTDELAPGQYEVGISNVQTTIGDNVNQNSQEVTVAESTAEATSEAETEVTTPEALQEAPPTNQTGGNTTSVLQDTNNPPPSAPDQGLVERDETFAPTIAARLETPDDGGTSYNLLQGGFVRIETMNETRASGSFEFTLSPAEDTARIVTVTGTFVDIPLTQTEQSK